MSVSKSTLHRALGVATYVFFGIGCLLLGFYGNTAYTEKRLAEVADPDQYWGQRAQFFAAPSYGGTIEQYVPQKLLSVRREKLLYTFRLTGSTRFIMKPDVTEIAPGAEVQVKYNEQKATDQHPEQKTALTVRLLSWGLFK